MSKQQFNVMSIADIEQLESTEHIELNAIHDEQNDDDLTAHFSVGIDDLI